MVKIAFNKKEKTKRYSIILLIAVILIGLLSSNFWGIGGNIWTNQGTKFLDYEINNIEVNSSNITLYGYGYVQSYQHYYSKAKGSNVTDLKNKVAGGYTHGYYLEVDGKTYMDNGGVHSGINYDSVSHTEINYAPGHYTYNYQQVGFSFTIPISDLMNISSNSKTVNFRLHMVLDDGSDGSLLISYINNGGSVDAGNYVINYPPVSPSDYISPSGFATLVRTGPGKNYSAAKDGYGRNLYFTTGNIYTVANGTLTGYKQTDSNGVTWFQVRYSATGGYDNIGNVKRYRTSPNSNGSYGYLGATFADASTNPFNLTITKKNYFLDVNGMLDGVANGGLANYGTCDVYINNSLVANDVSDYYSAHPYQSKFEIKDIKSKNGYQYNGVHSGSISGTINGNTSTYLNFSTSNYSINYDLVGGSISGQPTNYTINKTTKIPNPIKKGHEFLGWTGSNGSTPQKDLTIPVGSTGNKNYKANWKLVEFNVIFNTMGGTPVPSVIVKINNTIPVPKPPTRNGYMFDGWYTSTAYTSKWNFNTRITNHTTLYAKWIKNPDITANNRYFLEDEVFTEEDLIKNIIVNCEDQDFNISISGLEDGIIGKIGDYDLKVVITFPKRNVAFEKDFKLHITATPTKEYIRSVSIDALYTITNSSSLFDKLNLISSNISNNNPIRSFTITK